VVQALERSSWNQTHAGKLLGINRDQVRYRIEKFGLTPPMPRAGQGLRP
jgi:DNA-binding protein Fis